MTNKRKRKIYSSVKELAVKTFGPDPEETRRTLKVFNDRLLSSLMSRIRNKRNITQKQVADKMGISEKKVEELESAPHSKLTAEDIAKFASACEMDMHILFTLREKPPIMHRITTQVEGLEKLYKELREMCKDDIQMNLKASEVQIDVVERFLSGIKQQNKDMRKMLAGDKKIVEYKQEVQEEVKFSMKG